MFKCPSHGIKLLINSRYLKEETLVDLFRNHFRKARLFYSECGVGVDIHMIHCLDIYSNDSCHIYLFILSHTPTLRLQTHTVLRDFIANTHGHCGHKQAEAQQ